MDITAQDLKNFTKYVEENARRKDLGFLTVPSEIEKINLRLDNPKFKAKHKQYRERKIFLSSVLKVKEAA